MKITLFVLSCLLTVSYQQFWNGIPYIPRIAYFPLYYADFHPNDQNLLAYDSEDFTNQLVENAPTGDYGPLARTRSQLQAQKRFFIPNPLSLFNLFASSSTTTSTVTTTSTYWTTTSATATTATIVYCIPSYLFSMSYDLTGGTVYETTACAQRKREVALPDESIALVEPSQPNQVETSGVPDVPREGQLPDEPLLSSSHVDELKENPTGLRRSRRAVTYSTFTVTASSTATYYTFVPTTLKKTINMGSQIQCLPNGYVVC